MNERAWRKLRAKIEASPKNVTEQELVRLVVGAGWTEHPAKGTSHRPFTKEGCRQRLGVPRTPRGSVKAIYVRAALKAIDECMQPAEPGTGEGETE